MAGCCELLPAILHEQATLSMELNHEALTATVLNQYFPVKERAHGGRRDLLRILNQTPALIYRRVNSLQELRPKCRIAPQSFEL